MSTALHHDAAVPWRVGVVAFDPEGRLLLYNPGFAALVGLPPDALRVTMRADDIAAMIRACEAFAGPEGGPCLATHLTLSGVRRGSMRWVRASGMVLEVNTDPTLDGGFVVTISDVTEQRRSEAEQRRAEQTIRQRATEMDAMLANIRHGILLWSPERRLIALNRVAARQFAPLGEALVPGLSFDALVSRHHAQGIYGTGAEADAYLHLLLTHDRTEPLVTHRSFGPDNVMEVRSEPTPDGGFVNVVTDITEQRRNEADLRAANDAAETATTAKARFLATMSHELRTPLNSVIGFSDAMLRDRGGTDPAVVREFAEEIHTAGKRLLLLINTILDVSRIEAGRYDLSTDRIDFIRLTQGLLRQSRNAAMAAEIDLENELPLDMPQVRGDERRMQQVLGHLLSNAMKFSEPGGVARITMGRDGNGDLLVRVIDTGVGIAEENLDRVFEPFTQLDAGLDRRYEGAGLGLYLSRALVEAHGGRLTLRSRLGAGTTAEIRLPARRVIAAEVSRRGSDLAPDGGAANLTFEHAVGEHPAGNRVPESRAGD